MKLNEITNQNNFPTDKAKIENILINFLKLNPRNCTIHPNGVVDVNGDVNLIDKNLIKIPVQFGKVTGYFSCSENQLTSLEGCPTSVGDDFNCNDNKLTTLEHCPKVVDTDFRCSDNKLTSLKGCPARINGDFICSNNLLTSLKDAPNFIGMDFDCSNNRIASFEGISDIISHIENDLICGNNPLESGGLGLILIPHINHLYANFDQRNFKAAVSLTIIQKYFGRPNDIFDCQNELIENGFEEFAKL